MTSKQDGASNSLEVVVNWSTNRGWWISHKTIQPKKPAQIILQISKNKIKNKIKINIELENRTGEKHAYRTKTLSGTCHSRQGAPNTKPLLLRQFGPFGWEQGDRCESSVSHERGLHCTPTDLWSYVWVWISLFLNDYINFEGSFSGQNFIVGFFFWFTSPPLVGRR